MNTIGVNKKGKRSITLDVYLLFVSLVFLLSGLMLFVYCVFTAVPIYRLDVLSHPLFYLGVGFTVLCCFILQRRYGVFEL